jgi:hypothetical protein
VKQVRFVLKFKDVPNSIRSGCAMAFGVPAASQITVNGVTDRGEYTDAVTFTVQTQPGFSDSAFLNTNAIPTGVPVTINRPDFYQLRVFRTPDGGGTTNSLYLHFLVLAGEREDTEWGLPRQFAWPMIPSSSNEFAGAYLTLLAPSHFPVGYEIPVVAWVVDEGGHAVRANGFVEARAIRRSRCAAVLVQGFSRRRIPGATSTTPRSSRGGVRAGILPSNPMSHGFKSRARWVAAAFRGRQLTNPHHDQHHDRRRRDVDDRRGDNCAYQPAL